MIIVCEPICHGVEHVPFNAAFLTVLHKSFPDEIIRFFGEKTHIEYLSKEIHIDIENKIEWEKINLPERHSLQKHRFLSDKNLIKRLNNIFQCDKIIFTSFSESILFSIKLSKFYYLNSKKYYLIAHGGLNKIKGFRSMNPFLRMFDLFSIMSSLNNCKVKFIFLEEIIKITVESIIPNLSKNSFVISHPLTINSQILNNDKGKSQKLRIGFLGNANIEKGIDHFLAAAKIVKNKYPDNFEFIIVGKVFEKNENLEILDMKPCMEKLDRDEYVELAMSLDYACLPYQNDHYTLSPSGSMVDAISLKIPLIATRFGVIEWLFDKYGQLGILVNDASRLGEELIKAIDNKTIFQRDDFVSNIEMIRSDRSTDKLALSLKAQL